eukprot:gb/GECH01001332.1/.p1 GENE.gb/GECH01001332.1/~~gb/GECH01001332.1/.p1  ORF type:complete len:783 (+),score=191.05 gb/GECH01001332.1/:1-2349(+)
MNFGSGKNKRAMDSMRKGEVNELGSALGDPSVMGDDKQRREVLKRVIGYTTMGIDTSKLFPKMIMAASTKDVVQKKMVYQYISTYAKQKQDLAMLTINTLRKDCTDDSPVIRGLALRTFTSLRLPNITEHIIPILKQRLKDPAAYVRKTAVVSCLKIYHLSHQTFENEKLSNIIHNLTKDNDPTVAINALMILNELYQLQSKEFEMDRSLAIRYLNRHEQFNEWQLCYLLEMLLCFTPKNDQEAIQILNMLDSKLKNANSAVVLATTKVFLHVTENIPHINQQVYIRLRDPLITIMATSNNEIAFACLHHMKLMALREPSTFQGCHRDFYCRYNDPSYVKELKLKMLTLISNAENCDEVMDELSEYVSENDRETSRVSIQSIGEIAVNVPEAAEKAINHLLDFLDFEVDYIRAQTFVVLKDIVRKYEDQEYCKTFLPYITKYGRSIQDNESKIAFVWLLGEYGDIIRTSPYIMENYIDRFEDEEDVVQLEILSAAVKLFFKRPPEMQKMLGRLLADAIEGEYSVDVCERAAFFYRCLKADPREARHVLAAKKKLISSFTEESSLLLDRLFEEFNTLSVIYEQPSDRFVSQENDASIASDDDGDDYEQNEEYENISDANATYQQSSEASSSDAGMGMKSSLLKSNQDSSLIQFGSNASNSVNEVEDDGLELAEEVHLPANQFQQKWGSLSVATQEQVSLLEQPNADRVIEMFDDFYIRSMAKGDMGGTLRFFFYAKREGGNSYFLLEVKIDLNGNAAYTIKADEPDAAEEFGAIVQVVLREMF